MKFHLVRHGDKASGDYTNPRFRHQDQPLSDLGRQQANRLRDYLVTRPVAAIYTSEYIRTEQTARPLAEALQITPLVDARLNEIDNGLIEGLTDEQVGERFPEVWAAVLDGDRDFQWPGGESGAGAQRRIVEFIHQHRDEEGEMVVIAHDGIIRLLVCHILKMPVYHRFSLQLNTAGITEIEWDPVRHSWKLIRFNQQV